jgi:hypothetical protein
MTRRPAHALEALTMTMVVGALMCSSVTAMAAERKVLGEYFTIPN